ncbi:MAG: SDR family oxidoreductase [Arcobacteraceae bacterium]|nr:SDR family oxidoreductase [Arcobacteraceae bacterium]
MNGKKVLITGGLGNLGSWLTTYFANKYEVYVLSKNISIQLECKYKVIQANITNYNDLKSKLNIDFDYCIHTASYNEFFHNNYPKDALLINSLGTRNLIEVLKGTNIKNFIYLSTFHVYGSNDGIITENTQLNPKNDYASTHLFAEYYLKQFFNTHNFPFVTFRLTNSYGTPRYKNSTKWYLVLNDLVKSAYEKNKIILKSNGKAKRDFIWMGDVCSVIEKSLDFKPNNGNIFNLSSGTTFSMMDLANKVQDMYQQRYNKNIEIVINYKDKSLSLDLEVDNSKLKEFGDFNFCDKFNTEINNIFNLLEKN